MGLFLSMLCKRIYQNMLHFYRFQLLSHRNHIISIFTAQQEMDMLDLAP